MMATCLNHCRKLTFAFGRSSLLYIVPQDDGVTLHSSVKYGQLVTVHYVYTSRYQEVAMGQFSDEVLEYV